MVACPSCGQENPDGARFCNACATPLPEAERRLSEERKRITVVFVDLVGFTAQAERLDPEDVRAMLAPFHARVRDELERHGGTVEKFVGDAVMAVFGAPVVHEDDPERAVRAAVAIRDSSAGQPELQMRIAVNTGDALVNLGALPARGEAMVAGDVVNTAARLQAAAPVGGVLVGDATYRATRDAIDYREAPPVHAKGKAVAVRVWEALEPFSRLGVDRSAPSRTPLVGRERELGLLAALRTRLREGRAAQLVTLIGVPGIGKSRLVRELFELTDREPELITWRQGRCLPYGDGVTFWALGEIVKAEAGILETDPPAEGARKLTRAVAALIADEDEARWIEAELRALAGLGYEDATRDANADTAVAAWRRFVEAVGERGPGVLVFEDLHWADDGLLDFVDELVDWLRDVPILVVATARPELLERRPAWGGGKADATTISLQPLHEEDTARLIAALLDRPLQLADEQRAALEQTGGNPLFAEQYVRMLSERGSAGTLPESVQGVIAARLDALAPGEKELLQVASVHGKVFWLGGIGSALGQEPGRTRDLLRRLERKQFVRRERATTVAGDTQYAFQHVLLRDVAYGEIPRRARAEMHRRAAAWIEALGRPGDHAELLAHHYERALELARAAGSEDDPQLVRRAVETLRAAGERALSLSAFASAADLLDRALAYCPPGDPERPRLLLARVRTAFHTGGQDRTSLEEALEGLRRAGDAEGVAEAQTLTSRYAWYAGDREAADRHLTAALAAVADRPQSRAQAEALSALSGYHMLGGRFEASKEVGAEALRIAEALGLQPQCARVHILVGCARCCLGDDGGLDEIEEGIAVARAAGALDMVAVGWGNLSSELHFLARLDEARRAWREGLELSERHGLGRLHRGYRAEGIAWAYLDGRWDEAHALADEIIAVATSGERDYGDPAALAIRAAMRLARGDRAGADQDSRLAVELAQGSDAQAQAQGFCIRAAVALAIGRHDEAGELAWALAGLGPVLLPALCSPYPTLVEVAWVFRDLGRDAELAAVLDATPIASLWVDAARAIGDGDAARAADIVESIGHTTSAEYARRRAAEALAAEGA
jgi:class 3 adenylate cyclase/tetratricopeptide (TPR) repeat protein